jgi:hypothetical protein
MASENIGSLYPTKMPGYEDAADIQAALRLYHYGSESYDPLNTNPNQIPPESVAGHLKAIELNVADIDSRGIGSDFLEEEPESPVDGFIWVDADGLVENNFTVHTAIYQDNQPGGNLIPGSIWVDKDSSPLKMYVYDEDLGWREIGA